MDVKRNRLKASLIKNGDLISYRKQDGTTGHGSVFDVVGDRIIIEPVSLIEKRVEPGCMGLSISKDEITILDRKLRNDIVTTRIRK